MVEIGEWLELDVEGMLLAIGVETSAVTGSVGILEKYDKSAFPNTTTFAIHEWIDWTFYLPMRDSEVQVLLDEDKGRRGTL